MKKNDHGYGKGWLLIFYAFIAYFLSCAVSSSMNVASGTLSEAYGWSATLLTSLISIGSLANIAFGFLFGRLAVKYSVKKLSIIAISLFLMSLIGLGSATNLLIFGFFLVLSNGLASGVGNQMSPVLISKWFPKKKGIVMGMVTMGIPLCSGVATMIYSFGYKKMGGIGGFSIFILIGMIGLIILVFGLSDRPQDKGFLPDNGIEVEKSEKVSPQRESIWTTKKLLSTPQVWIHGATLGIQLLFAGGLMVQLYPRLLEIGFTANIAAFMMLASGLLALPGSYISGLIDAKIGPRKAACTTYVFGFIAMCLNLTGNTVCVWFSLIFIGMVVGGAANWPASLCIEEFGEDFARGYGIIQPIIQVVGAIGPVFFATIAGMTGNYRLSYVCGAILMIIGLVTFICFAKPGFAKCEE